MNYLRNIIICSALFTVLGLSFFDLAAAKFDTVDNLWLTLGLGIIAVLTAVMLGLHAHKAHPRISLLLAGFVILVWLSYFFSKTKNYGFSEAVIYTLSAFLGITVTTLSKQMQHWLIRILVFFGSASALYGFWYFPTHGENRMAGLFMDAADPRHFFPNAAATFLLMLWPLVLQQNIFKKIWPLIITPFLLSALLLTLSRGAVLVFIVQIASLGFYTVFSLPKKQWKSIAIQTALVILTTLVLTIGLIQIRARNFTTPAVQEKIAFTKGESITSVEERKDFWKGSLILIAKNPLLGSGPMSFRYAYPPLQKHFLGLSDHPHNWLLKIGVENGLPAALVFLVFIVTLFAITLTHRRTDPSILILAVAVFGGLLHNMIDYNMNFLPTIFTFFIIAGILIGHHRAGAEKNRPGVLASLIWIIILITVSALSLKELSLLETTIERDPYFEPFISRYALSYIPRDFFIGTAEELMRSDSQSNLNDDLIAPLLVIHQNLNPLDARSYYYRGDYEKTLALDPMNHFSYYRSYLETKKNLPAELSQKLETLLKEYDNQLAENIHYTAFTDNPEEAARIHELQGNFAHAQQLRAKAAAVRESFALSQNFNKQIGPRTLRELFTNKHSILWYR